MNSYREIEFQQDFQNFAKLTHWAAMRPTYFYLSNARRFYSSMGKLYSSLMVNQKIWQCLLDR
jgi:hypothetical protein